MQTTNKVTTIATLLKCHSGLLYLSLFFSCTVISDLPYDINMFLINLFFSVIHSKDELAKVD